MMSKRIVACYPKSFGELRAIMERERERLENRRKRSKKEMPDAK